MCHAWIAPGIVSGTVLMTDRLRHTRREYQNFSILNASGSLMAVVPCVEYPQDNYYGYPCGRLATLHME